MARKISGPLLIGLFTVIVAECLSYWALHYLIAKRVFYRPSKASHYKSYLETRDKHLGWTSKVENPAGVLVSLYGGSFTAGSGVSTQQSWAFRLQKLLLHKVNNLGVGAYGTDQSFMRYQLNSGDSAKIVVLVHTSANILNNINQYRDFLYPFAGYGFKPRFIVDSKGRLTKISLPAIPTHEYSAFLENPREYLKHEYFLPGSIHGPKLIHFPFTISLVGGLNHDHILAKIKNRPWYANYYETGHPSRALEVTSPIPNKHSTVVQNG